LLALGPSGGGYGNPFERDPQAVLADVREGYISSESAVADYGVVLHDGAVDLAATKAHRVV
jgi:N-methylhydantoinase B